MYNAKQIERFIDKVNKEASTAAQAIYDKYEPELIQRIKNQMRAGDKLIIGMGTATFNKSDKATDFCDVVARIQYSDSLEAGFSFGEISK